MYIYIYIHNSHLARRRDGGRRQSQQREAEHLLFVRSISEISSCCFGPRPWHIEIRHRVKKASTIMLFGFETLKLKIRRLKLWKPTALSLSHTCHILPPSEIDLGLCLAVFAGSGGK